MEIDFLGLNRKDSPKMVKDKSKGVCIDSVARMQWPHSCNASSPPLGATKENKQGQLAYGPLSSVFLPFSTTGYAFHSNTKPPCFSKTFPVLDKTASASSSNYFSFKNENLVAASMEQQNLGGISVAEPPSTFLKNGFDNGTTNLRNKAKCFSGLPGQMTIFYADAVHVYHDISPETAEAIMLMAGNGCDTQDFLKPVSEDIHRNQLQPPHDILYSRQNADGTFIEGSTTVPQARKATLARFLEKRKDRLTNVRPYGYHVNKEIGGLHYYSPNEMNTSLPFIQRGDAAS